MLTHLTCLQLAPVVSADACKSLVFSARVTVVMTKVIINNFMALTACDRQRTTGNATLPAVISAAAKRPRNTGEAKPAVSAPGVASIMELSTLFVMVIDAVSDAPVRPKAFRNGTFACKKGDMVRA